MWNYYRDEANNSAEENEKKSRINNNKTATSKYFEYKTKMTEKTLDNESRLDTEDVVLYKCLSNFLRSLGLPLIKYKLGLDL